MDIIKNDKVGTVTTDFTVQKTKKKLVVKERSSSYIVLLSPSIGSAVNIFGSFTLFHMEEVSMQEQINNGIIRLL